MFSSAITLVSWSNCPILLGSCYNYKNDVAIFYRISGKNVNLDAVVQYKAGLTVLS